MALNFEELHLDITDVKVGILVINFNTKVINIVFSKSHTPFNFYSSFSFNNYQNTYKKFVLLIF